MQGTSLNGKMTKVHLKTSVASMVKKYMSSTWSFSIKALKLWLSVSPKKTFSFRAIQNITFTIFTLRTLMLVVEETVFLFLEVLSLKYQI